jgi:HPt (histidine-containing phosphotransfer) domain-containing protein
LREIAHQLKGAAACYGYPSITESAAELERNLMAEEAELSALAEKVEDLLTLCRRAAASGSGS